MKNLLFLTIVWYSLFAHAQKTIGDSILQKTTRTADRMYDYGVRLPVVVPPSPQAQQYMRYGEVPVDISTGVPDINIPVYTLEANGLTIPISLSYHASGNKVEDVPSCVGLGWVLNAGGIITQTVNGGLPDDLAPFMFTSSKAANDFYTADREAHLSKGVANFLWGNLHNEGNNSLNKLMSDRFFYRFNGNSGAFRANLSTGQLEHVSPAPIKINSIKGSDGLWTKIELTDAEGRIWTFKRYKPVQAVYQHHGQHIYHSYEYYPEKITFPNISDEVTFTYSTGSRYLQTTVGQTGYFGQTPVYSFRFDLSSRQWGVDLDFDTSEYINLKTQTYSIDPVLLSSISWRGTTISFSYLKDRKDLMKDRLTHVMVSSNGRSICSADLTNTTYLGSNTKNWRMLLSGVKINAQVYRFNYNTMSLPDYTHYNLNCQQDFWGYYNGTNSDRWIPFKWEWIGNPRHNSISAPQYIGNLREAQATYTQAGILTEVIYPTKGRTVFTYEQNQGSNVYHNIKPVQPTIDYFGGVRIKQIDNYDGNTKLSTKSYEYLSGGPTTTLTNWHFFEKKEFYFTPSSLPVHDFTMISGMDKVPFKTDSYASSSSGYYPIDGPFGQSVIYTKVIEYNGTSTHNSGKTEYTFSGHFRGSNLAKNTDYGEERALLISQKEYENCANNYILKKETIHTYETINLGTFTTGLAIIEKSGYSFGLLPQNIPYAEDMPGFIYDYYNIYQIDQTDCSRKLELLSNTVVKTYTNALSTSESTQYLYDTDYRLLSPIVVTRVNSDGVSYKEEYLHSFNYPSDNICKVMASKNMLSQVIEKKMFKNEAITPMQSIKTDYMQNGIKIRTNKIKRTHQNNVMEEVIVFHEYNDAGNIVYLSKNDFSKAVYIWGYNNKYPIAEIQNATYDEVTKVVNKATLEAIAAKTEPTSSDWSIITALRTHTQLKKAFITIYKYIPDVGVIETIHPNGLLKKYIYDSFNRLYQIINQEGKIIEQYNYNYCNQSTDIGSSSYYNIEFRKEFTKNDCNLSFGEIGQPIDYVVEAGKHCSSISQEDANQMAYDDLLNNGQSYANLNGKCSEGLFKTFHFQTGDPYGRLDWWKDRGDQFFSYTFAESELGYNYDYIVTHDTYYPGWKWLANGKEVLNAGQEVDLIMDPDIYARYPSNTTFTYDLPKSETTYSVTIKANNWNSGKWSGNSGLSKVGFSQFPSNYQVTLTVSSGETVTIYASGEDGYHSYPNDLDHWYYKVAGFYDINHVAYKIGAPNNSGIDSYTFTVNRDMDIYVDFQYVTR